MSWILYHLTTLLLLGEDSPSEKIWAPSCLIFRVNDSSTSELGEDASRGREEGEKKKGRSVLSYGHTFHNFLRHVPWKTPLWNIVVFIVPIYNPWYYSQHLHEVFFFFVFLFSSFPGIDWALIINIMKWWLLLGPLFLRKDGVSSSK